MIGAARETYGDDMGAFLCWLGVRLMEMHRILRPDGSLYLHIDHTRKQIVKALIQTQDKARDTAEWVRDCFHTDDCRALIKRQLD